MAHMTRHELKHDEMGDVGARIADWYESKSKYINIILIVLIVGLVGYKLFTLWRDSKTTKASTEVGLVLQNYTMAGQQQDEAKRRELLNTAASDAARISREYEGTPAGKTAQLILGNTHYQMAMINASNPEEHRKSLSAARDAYEAYLRKAITAEEKAQGQLALGHTLENLLFTTKDLALVKDASNAYEEVRRYMPDSYLAAEATLSKARLLEAQQGREADAAKLYQEVMLERKVEPKAAKKAEPGEPPRDIPADRLKPEQAAEIQSLQKLSYANVAKEALETLNTRTVSPPAAPK